MSHVIIKRILFVFAASLVVLLIVAFMYGHNKKPEPASIAKFHPGDHVMWLGGTSAYILGKADFIGEYNINRIQGQLPTESRMVYEEDLKLYVPQVDKDSIIISLLKEIRDRRSVHDTTIIKRNYYYRPK